MDNPYDQLMREAMALHDKKRHDYSTENDRFSNFTRTAEIVSWFKNPIDQVFACMIGNKICRLAELRNGKKPNNESIRDSHIDLINYAALWGSYYDAQPKSHFIGYRCNLCKITFAKEKDLLLHLDIHNNYINGLEDTSTHD